MPKKSRRQVSSQYVRPVAAAQPSRTTEFNPDYTHIKHELRRIAIIAGSFVAVLIVLAIFQNQLFALLFK